jgi:orotidine-5'-phosphate decarboxylase
MTIFGSTVASGSFVRTRSEELVMVPFSVRLTEAVRRYGPLCVGIDPRWESLPESIRQANPEPAEAFRAFGLRVLDLVRPFTGVIKPQAAFFEQYGPAGFAAMADILRAANGMGFVTILDAKRGDIASTATAYAEAAFGPTWQADALTVNPYLGSDAVEPFITTARRESGGLFILVRTSNPGGGLFQNLACDGVPVYVKVAEAVAEWNRPSVGASGLGDIGAVVGATHPSELRLLREKLPNVWFLVPGYGAQGGTAEDVRGAYLTNGLGAVVNSSRGVTFPFNPADPKWETAIVTAAERASRELRA